MEGDQYPDNDGEPWRIQIATDSDRVTGGAVQNPDSNFRLGNCASRLSLIQFNAGGQTRVLMKTYRGKFCLMKLNVLQ